MAAPMWRMNGLWRRMAGVLVLCALLLSNGVMCDDATDATDAPAADEATETPAVTGAVGSGVDATDSPLAGSAPTDSVGANSAPSAAPGDSSLLPTTGPTGSNPDNQDEDTSGTTVSPTVRDSVVLRALPDDSHVVRKVVPDVKCVGEKDVPEGDAVTAVVATNDCEASKRIIQDNPAEWCKVEECNLEIFQSDNTMLVSSKNAELSTLAKVLQSEALKDKLGVKKTEVPSSSGASVFVGILVTGLLAALAITVGYFKCQRRSDTKGVRLAEEAYPVDQENQGNTLVSVAPLNPPPETQEKPSVNGESPEAAKTQPPPPTNGHSTTKTADTEL